MNISNADPESSHIPKLEPFLGTWILVSSITDGRPASDAEIQGVRVKIMEGKHTVWVRDQIVAHEIPFHIDFSSTPSATTDYLLNGQQIKGISKVEGDILTSCVAAVGQERPETFASPPGSGFTLRVFRRLVE